MSEPSSCVNIIDPNHMNINYKIGDCREVLKNDYEEGVFDACVTDSPYGIGFMGKDWDRSGIAFDVELWRDVYRVLKPGSYLLNFGGTRTYDLMVGAVREAGFEIRDTIVWIYGQGIAKGLNISKAIDKMMPRIGQFEKIGEYLKKRRKAKTLSDKQVAKHFPSKTGGTTGCVWNWENGMNVPTKEQWETLTEILDLDDRFDTLIERIEAEREVVGNKKGYKAHYGGSEPNDRHFDITLPATPDAKKWDGWHTNLKPAVELILQARKLISEKNVAMNVLKHGTGGLNIDGTRIEGLAGKPWGRVHPHRGIYPGWQVDNEMVEAPEPHPQGRFPANIILDEETAELLDAQSGILESGLMKAGTQESKVHRDIYGQYAPRKTPADTYADKGGASRFFYVAKASRRERWFYCEMCGKAYSGDKRDNHTDHGNLIIHETQKPEQLMRYLIRLVTPKGGTVLDPFLGSGTTLVAARLEGVNALGVEIGTEYEPLIKGRLNALPRALEEFHQPTTTPSPNASIRNAQETE